MVHLFPRKRVEKSMLFCPYRRKVWWPSLWEGLLSPCFEVGTWNFAGSSLCFRHLALHSPRKTAQTWTSYNSPKNCTTHTEKFPRALQLISLKNPSVLSTFCPRDAVGGSRTFPAAAALRCYNCKQVQFSQLSTPPYCLSDNFVDTQTVWRMKLPNSNGLGTRAGLVGGD